MLHRLQRTPADDFNKQPMCYDVQLAAVRNCSGVMVLLCREVSRGNVRGDFPHEISGGMSLGLSRRNVRRVIVRGRMTMEKLTVHTHKRTHTNAYTHSF